MTAKRVFGVDNLMHLYKNFALTIMQEGRGVLKFVGSSVEGKHLYSIYILLTDHFTYKI